MAGVATYLTGSRAASYFTDFMMQFSIAHKPNIRVGQAVMTALYRFDHLLYIDIVGSEVDCFYIDDNVTKVIRKILENCND